MIEGNVDIRTISLNPGQGRLVSLESSFGDRSIFLHLIKLKGEVRMFVLIHIILVVEGPYKISIRMGVKAYCSLSGKLSCGLYFQLGQEESGVC